jgi:hypothetical protein
VNYNFVIFLPNFQQNCKIGILFFSVDLLFNPLKSIIFTILIRRGMHIADSSALKKTYPANAYSSQDAANHPSGIPEPTQSLQRTTCL